MSVSEVADKLCLERFGSYPINIIPLRASGSSRKYFRLKLPNCSSLMCVSDNIRENKTFIELSRFLKHEGVPVPEIFSISESFEAYLLEDLGDLDFLSLLIKPEGETAVWTTIQEIIKNLLHFQRLPSKGWEKIVEFEPIGSKLIKYDLNYARINLFDVSSVKYNSKALLSDYEKLERKLLNYPLDLWGLMFRDFQSRNIMIQNGKPYFIDYQSCRMGPGIYDIVSFAWQAKANFTKEERIRIINIYIEEMSNAGVKGAEDVWTNVTYWALFRILQTLGAYGLRGLKEGKPHFIQSIPIALKNCNEILTEDLKGEYPELENLINSLNFCNFAKK